MTTPLATDVEVWTVDGIAFGSVIDDSLGSIVDEVTGWDEGTEPRSARTVRPSAAGSYRGPNWKSERIVTIAGWVDVPDEIAALAVKDRITAICSDPYSLYTFRHTDARSGEDRYALVELDGRPLASVQFGDRPLRVDFSLQFAAVDNRKYDTQALTASTLLAQDAPGGIQWGGPAGSTGVQWGGPAGSTGLVYQTASGETGTLLLTNPGTAPAPIVFTISGGLVVTPSITVASDGRALEYGPTVPAGSVLEIDTGTGRVTLDGGNQRPNMTRADFFEIPPRSSLEVVFRSPTPSPSAELTAVWHPAWQ